MVQYQPPRGIFVVGYIGASREPRGLIARGENTGDEDNIVATRTLISIADVTLFEGRIYAHRFHCLQFKGDTSGARGQLRIDHDGANVSTVGLFAANQDWQSTNEQQMASWGATIPQLSTVTGTYLVEAQRVTGTGNIDVKQLMVLECLDVGGS